MSQFAVCLVEFLLFLGIPYLRALQKLISAAIDQLEVLKGEALSHLTNSSAAAIAAQKAIGSAQLIVDEVRNVLGSLPTGAFQQCSDVANLIGTIKSSFDTYFNYFELTSNQLNRVLTNQALKAALSSEIDTQIQYLQDLNSQITIVIAQLLRSEAAQL